MPVSIRFPWFAQGPATIARAITQQKREKCLGISPFFPASNKAPQGR
jgi:hypothetical protein